MARSWRSAAMAAAATLATVSAPSPTWSKNWQLAGPGELPTDRQYVDLDSIRVVNGLRLAKVQTIFAAARPNRRGLLMDQNIQEVAFDCGNASAVVISSESYLNDKRVGSTPEVADWSNHMLPVAAASIHLLKAVCGGTPAAAGPGGGGGMPPISGGAVGPAAPARPAPTRFSTGSGIVLDADGFVLTNVHVINGCKTIVAKVPASNPVAATIEAVDPKNDLAILRTVRNFGTPAKFRPEDEPVRLGENVGVIGYPLTGILSSEPKATFGQINSVAGMNNDYTLLQISAQVQPGNSGGPVLDDAGLVVGIVVSEASPKLAEITGSIPENINFAIKDEIAQIFLKSHGVAFSVADRGWRLRTEDIAERGERSTALIVCAKQ